MGTINLLTGHTCVTVQALSTWVTLTTLKQKSRKKSGLENQLLQRNNKPLNLLKVSKMVIKTLEEGLYLTLNQKTFLVTTQLVLNADGPLKFQKTGKSVITSGFSEPRDLTDAIKIMMFWYRSMHQTAKQPLENLRLLTLLCADIKEERF